MRGMFERLGKVRGFLGDKMMRRKREIWKEVVN